MFISSTFKMICLVTIIFLLIFSITNVNTQVCPKIVGGEEVDITDFPYQVSYELNNIPVCGAAIIGKKWVLTAAHCTNGRPIDIISVRAGITNLNETGQRVQVKQVYQHPQYTRLTTDCDISVLELETELTLSSTVQPIELAADGSDEAPGTKVVVTGWGDTAEGGSGSPILLKTEVTVVDRDECRKIVGENDITENMICAGLPEGGADACQGDSGGPLVADGILVGIVSWGDGCGEPNCPGMYSRIGTLRSYIKYHSL